MLYTLESWIVQALLWFFSVEQLNGFLTDPRNVAVLVGGLVSVAAAVLGVFLVLRKMSMVTDAISHTVLLGIVLAVMILTGVFGLPFDLSSPWLLFGAALAGLATVALTELILNSGLVKADAALGLAFPFLFAVAIILLSIFVDDAHLDGDAVMVGEIGVAWANTNSHCLDNCAPITITPDDPRAETGQRCVNCSRESGITPRSAQAVFEVTCSNCGTYSAAQAWGARLIDSPPQLVYFPKAITVLLIVALANIAFVTLFYKELKLSTFDAGLAATLGFRPNLLRYALMMLVSLTAVAAFDAVGSILVIAFFVVPTATLYLLTDRLALMLWGSPLVGVGAAWAGYEFARGSFLGLPMSNVLTWLDATIGLGGYTAWNTSISAAMVMMLGFFFTLAWVFSPRYGLLMMALRRLSQGVQFGDDMLLGHIYNHQNTPRATEELRLSTLHEHMNWERKRLERSVTRLRLAKLIAVRDGQVALSARGQQRVEAFHATILADVRSRQGVAVGD